MSKVYQCDRCKKIFEPRRLKDGEPYIARTKRINLDLCPECYDGLLKWLREFKETENDSRTHKGGRE